MAEDIGDPFAILGVAEDASQEEIERRRRFLLRSWHPDRWSTEQERVEAEEMLKRMNLAWELIGTPEKRAAYLRSPRSSSHSGSAPPPGSGKSGARSSSPPPREEPRKERQRNERASTQRRPPRPVGSVEPVRLPSEDEARAALRAWAEPRRTVRTERFEGELRIVDVSIGEATLTRVIEERGEQVVLAMLGDALPGMTYDGSIGSVAIDLPTTPKEATFHLLKDGTLRQLPCGSCHTSGVVRCGWCHGSGSRSCARDEACAACYGSGRRTHVDSNGRSHTVACGMCGGRGRVPCRKCGGSGRVTCFNCAGRGLVQCSTCGGAGEVLQFVLGTIKRTLKREKVEAPRPSGASRKSMQRSEAFGPFNGDAMPANLPESLSGRISGPLGTRADGEVDRALSGSVVPIVRVTYSYNDQEREAFLAGRAPDFVVSAPRSRSAPAWRPGRRTLMGVSAAAAGIGLGVVAAFAISTFTRSERPAGTTAAAAPAAAASSLIPASTTTGEAQPTNIPVSTVRREQITTDGAATRFMTESRNAYCFAGVEEATPFVECSDNRSDGRAAQLIRPEQATSFEAIELANSLVLGSGLASQSLAEPIVYAYGGSDVVGCTFETARVRCSALDGNEATIEVGAEGGASTGTSPGAVPDEASATGDTQPTDGPEAGAPLSFSDLDYKSAKQRVDAWAKGNDLPMRLPPIKGYPTNLSWVRGAGVEAETDEYGTRIRIGTTAERGLYIDIRPGSDPVTEADCGGPIVRGKVGPYDGAGCGGTHNSVFYTWNARGYDITIGAHYDANIPPEALAKIAATMDSSKSDTAATTDTPGDAVLAVSVDPSGDADDLSRVRVAGIPLAKGDRITPTSAYVQRFGDPRCQPRTEAGGPTAVWEDESLRMLTLGASDDCTDSVPRVVYLGDGWSVEGPGGVLHVGDDATAISEAFPDARTDDSTRWMLLPGEVATMEGPGEGSPVWATVSNGLVSDLFVPVAD